MPLSLWITTLPGGSEGLEGLWDRKGDKASKGLQAGTYLRPGRISIFSPGSCFPNWLQGKPNTTKPAGFNSSWSAFSSVVRKRTTRWPNPETPHLCFHYNQHMDIYIAQADRRNTPWAGHFTDKETEGEKPSVDQKGWMSWLKLDVHSEPPFYGTTFLILTVRRSPFTNRDA